MQQITTAPEPAPGDVRITEIFHSLQGESRPAGYPTVFVRLTGCPLRCSYCDTAYAFSGGRRMTFEEILAAVRAFATPRVCVTGGEPLAQPGTFRLLETLCGRGYQVSLETGGALDISGVDSRVSVVLDLKTPGSGEVMRNRWENIPHLDDGDQVKFVLVDRHDYEWACERMREHRLDHRCEVLFSPAWGQLDPATLADWILADRLPARLQLQLHKVLWGDVRGR